MSGTDLYHAVSGTDLYYAAPAQLCLVLTSSALLPAQPDVDYATTTCLAVSGTDLPFDCAATCTAVSGTEVDYVATRIAVSGTDLD